MGKRVNCSVCGVWIELLEGTQYRKYCDTCRKALKRERARVQQRKVKAEREAEKAAYLSAAYAPAEEKPARRKKAAAKSELLPKPRAVVPNYAPKAWDLQGKSSAQVCVESRALGMSYGQYCAACNAGTIDRVLLDMGITDGLARVRKAWREHQRQKNAPRPRRKAADGKEAIRNQQAWGSGYFAPPPKS